jgi:heptosyltransferase-1
VLDAQGLMKSALIARLAKGVRLGLDRSSAWEPATNLFYQKTFSVNPELHAITRVRTLFAKALDYSFDPNSVSYGVDRSKFKTDPSQRPYVLFLHGTTWETKHWPEPYWEVLAKKINDLGLLIKLPWSNEVEKKRAERIAKVCKMGEVLPRLNLAGVAKVIAGAKAVISVDTGLGHLTAALDVPAVSLYGPTDPEEIGTVGPNQLRLQSDRACAATCSAQKCTLVVNDNISPVCFEKLTPDRVVEALSSLL